MTYPTPAITVNVDSTNPGQFFACCGLLELADRLWPGAEGWFADDDQDFYISAGGTLDGLVDAIATAELKHVRPSDPHSSPLSIGTPFRALSIDWWETDLTGARDLKVWAGSMESFGIAQALQFAMRDARFRDSKMFDVGMVVSRPGDAKSKREPYCFDSRRASNSHSRDVGFSTSDLEMTSIAHPAVELLCLVGLQVARPVLTQEKRIYDYYTWHIPLMPNLVLAASTGSLQLTNARSYRFENWFRTGQKKQKAFRYAVPTPQGS